MVRLCLLLVVLLNGAAIAAQSQINIDALNAVPANSRDYYRLAILTPTATAVNIDVAVTTPESTGLFVRLTDLDQASTLTVPYRADAFWPAGSAGSVNFSMALPARSGQHELFLEINDYTAGAAIDMTFTGTVTASAGTLTELDRKREPEIVLGARLHWDRVLDYHDDFSDLSDGEFKWEWSTSASLTTFGSIGIYGLGVDAYSVADDNTSPAQIIHFGSGAMGTGYVLDETVLQSGTWGSWTGDAPMTLYYSKNDPGGLIDVRLFSYPQTTLSAVLGGPGSGGGGSGGGTCSTDGSHSPFSYLAVVSVLMFFGWRLRRREA